MFCSSPNSFRAVSWFSVRVNFLVLAFRKNKNQTTKPHEMKTKKSHEQDKFSNPSLIRVAIICSEARHGVYFIGSRYSKLVGQSFRGSHEAESLGTLPIGKSAI